MYSSVFLCLFKGVKITGKVVYVTVTLPYILLTVFLIRALLLPGSVSGIYFYLKPDFTKLSDPKIWTEACVYALYSLGIASGGIPTMAGHNKFKSNCTRDSLTYVFSHMLSTIFAGVSFFSIVGHVAHIRNVPISAFESSGFNLGFIVYPEVVSVLPFSQIWSVLTFITFLTLGFDSIVPSFEVIVMAVCDVFPTFANRRLLVIALILLVNYLLGLLYITQGGMYILTLVEWYCYFPSLTVFAVLECFVVSWIYGIENLTADIEMMWGKNIPIVFSYGLRFVSPVLMMAVFSYAIYSYHPPNYGDFVYPSWATGIGWMISMSSVTPVVVVFIWHVFKAEGASLKEKLKNAVKPSPRWGPMKEKVSSEDNVMEKMMEDL